MLRLSKDSSLAEFGRDLIRERTMATIAAARARGRKSGRNSLSLKRRCLAQAVGAARHLGFRSVQELGINRVTLDRYVGPKGELWDYGQRVLGLV